MQTFRINILLIQSYQRQIDGCMELFGPASGHLGEKQFNCIRFPQQSCKHLCQITWQDFLIDESYTATLEFCNLSVVCDSLTPIYTHINLSFFTEKHSLVGPTHARCRRYKIFSDRYWIFTIFELNTYKHM